VARVAEEPRVAAELDLGAGRVDDRRGDEQVDAPRDLAGTAGGVDGVRSIVGGTAAGGAVPAQVEQDGGRGLSEEHPA
jgi:hypothetical protein